MLFGAVDLGSNSFRVEIGRVEDERILTQSYWKESVRLAGGFDASGALTPEAQARALATLARFHEKLDGLPAAQVRAVGTQAMRAATNGREFLQKAERVLGYRIELLSGHEEARLVFKGCAHTLPPSPKRRLVVDIGGASTECIIGEGLEALQCESHPVGCVNTSLRFFPDGKVSAKALERAITACSAKFEESARRFGAGTYEEAFGSAGTFAAVSEICAACGWSSGEVRPEHIERLKQKLIEARDVRSLGIEGLKEDRREVIPGGLAVLAAVFRTLGVSSMLPASGALRVGLLYDLLGRLSDRDTRGVTVDGILKTGHIDRDQAERVSRLALFFYRELGGSPDSPEGKLLRWAGLLHEVGMSISSSRYHRHSHYIISNADMPGFSRPDQELMASLVLGQRGNVKKIADEIDRTASLSAYLALRLAVIFAHARRDSELPILKVRRGFDGIQVQMDSVWLNARPLTDYLLGEESLDWSRAGYSVIFSRF